VETKDLARLAPCKQCPFRRDVRPFLRPARAAQLASYAKRGITFLCHETTRETGDGTEKHCAGKLVLARKLDRLYHDQLVRVGERLGADFDKVVDPLDVVYDTPKEMIEAYRKENERGLV
jgi:hypothetical protein